MVVGEKSGERAHVFGAGGSACLFFNIFQLCSSVYLFVLMPLKLVAISQNYLLGSTRKMFTKIVVYTTPMHLPK